MSDYNPDDRTRRQVPQASDEIPRRGYDRRATGQPKAPAEPPPVYSAPPRAGLPPPGTPQPPVRGGKRAPRDSGLYLPWWTLVILILVVGGVAIVLLLAVANLSSAIVVEPTPRVVVVTGQVQPTQPSAANAAPATGIPTVGATVAPTIATAAPSDTPIPGGCLLNEEVIIFGTGGVGLNLRDRPGGDVQFIAKEGETMLVLDGPQYFDGIEWCQVRSTAQSSSFGWAALQYLLPEDAVSDE